MLLLMSVAAEASDGFAGCPDFKKAYTSCEKIDGSQPPFFESLQIVKTETLFEFTTKLLPGLPFDEMTTQYHPDKLIRLGSDNHYPTNSTPLVDLPSHEASYCEDGKLFRSEVTFLPDNTIAQELITMEVNDQDGLSFKLQVDGELELEASCLAVVSELSSKGNASVAWSITNSSLKGLLMTMIGLVTMATL